MKHDQGAGNPSTATDQSRATPVTNRDVDPSTLLHHEQNCGNSLILETEKTEPARRRNYRQQRFTTKDGLNIDLTILQELHDTTLSGPDGLRRRGNVKGIQELVMDLDPPAGLDIDAYLADFRDAYTDLGIHAPTLVVRTGGSGAHAHWKLGESMPVAQGMGLWRRLSGVLFWRLGITGDSLTRVLSEHNCAKMWPMPGQLHRKTNQPATIHSGDPANTVSFCDLSGDVNQAFDNLSTDLQALINPVATVAAPPSTDYRTGADPDLIELIRRGIENLPPKESNDHSWPWWKDMALSATAGDISYGNGAPVLYNAIINACGHRNAAKKLVWEDPTDITLGTLRGYLKDSGKLPQVAPRRDVTAQSGSDAARTATGANQGASTGTKEPKRPDATERAKAHAATHPEARMPVDQPVIPNGDMDAVWGENFMTSDDLFRAHYPYRQNMLTRDLETQEGDVVNVMALHLNARGRGLRVWDGNEPKAPRGKGDDAEGPPVKTCHPLSRTDFQAGIQAFANGDRFYPQQQWLQGLLDDQGLWPISHRNLASRYFKRPGTGPHELDDTIMEKGIMGIVARILHPGAPVQMMPIFHGDQKVGKSWFCRVLGGDYFLETLNLGSRDKDELMKYGGHLVAEFGEFDTRKKSQNLVKDAITTQSDRIRMPYADKDVLFPRTVTFWGTTNDDELLNDPSGSRRFGIIHVDVARIDVPRFEEERDAIFKSAAMALLDGESQLLGDDEVDTMQERNKGYEITDVRLERLQAYLVAMGEATIREQGFTVYHFMTSELGLGMSEAQLDFRQQGAIKKMILMAGFRERQLKASGFRRRMWPTTWEGLG